MEDRIVKAREGNATELELSACLITDLASLAGMKNLETLWIEGNPIYRDQIEMLKKDLSYCFMDISGIH